MIVELLRDPPAEPAPKGAERRRSRRHPVTLPATISAVENETGEAMDVQVRNISLHGAGLSCAAPLVVESAHRLHIGAGPLQLNARIKIVSVRLQRDGSWNIGVEFF
jgi:hypothetical protein